MSIPSATEQTSLLSSFEPYKPSTSTNGNILGAEGQKANTIQTATLLKTEQLSQVIHAKTSTPKQSNQDLKPKLIKLQNNLEKYQTNNPEEMEKGGLRNFSTSSYQTFPLPLTNAAYMMNETFSPRKHCRIYFAASLCYLLFMALILFGAYRQKND